jgi:hypothetical protein
LYYEETLKSVNSWLSETRNSLLAPVDLSRAIPSASLINSFTVNRERLKSIYQNYLSGSQSKSDLATSMLISVLSDASDLSSNIVSSVFGDVLSMVSGQQSTMTSTYVSLLNQLNDLQGYMSESDYRLPNVCRNLALWRQPVVSLQSSEVTDYGSTFAAM